VYLGDTGGALYDGQQQVLYWSDVSTELAFVVPLPTSHALAAGSLISVQVCLCCGEFLTGLYTKYLGSDAGYGHSWYGTLYDMVQLHVDVSAGIISDL